MPSSTDSATNTSTAPGRPVRPSVFDDRPDDFFALVAGLYASFLVAPATTALVARPVTDPAALYLAFLGSFALTTTVGALVVRRIRGLPERLGRTWKRWLPALAGPVAVAVAGGVIFTTGEVSDSDPLLAIVAATGGFVAGGALGVMARTRYAKAVRAEAEEHATWRAGWSDQRRRPLRTLGILVVVGAGVAFVASVVFHSDPVRFVSQLLIPIGIVVISVGQDRTYTATSAGLEVQMPAARVLHDWDSFEGYTVADDAIVLYYRAPWRLPVVCARTDIDDEEAVVAALDSHLHRLPTL